VEIFEFLELSARRLVALALLAVVVAVPTAGLLALHGTHEYRATATARLGPFMPPGIGPGVQDQIEEGYQAAVNVSSVKQAVTRATGVSVRDLHDHLTVMFPTSGTTAQVTLTSTTRDAGATVRTAAVTALKFLAQQEVDDAQAVVDEADRQTAQAVSELEAFEARTGIGDVFTRLKALTAQQLSLQARLTADPFDASAAALLTETRSQLAAVTDGAAQYSQLQATANRAVDEEQAASKALAAAQTRLAAAASGTTVALKQVVAVGHVKNDIVYGFGAGLVAVLIAVMLLALDELRRQPLVGAHYPSATPPRPRRRTLSLPAGRLSVGGTVLLLPVSLLVSAGALLLFDQHRTTLALVLAAPLGLLAGVLAFTRFEAFLAAMIVVRASLDSLNISTRGTAGLDPGVALGGVFIVAAVLWLAAQRRSGRWVRVSRVTWALWGFVAACLISIPASVLPAYSFVGTSKVASGVLMFSVLEQYLGQRPERAKLLVGCLFLSLPVPAVVGLAQWVTHHGNQGTAGVSRVSGTFVHPSTFALYLLLVLPLALVLVPHYRGRARAVLIAMACVCGLLIVVTYTRDAWIAAIVSVAYLGIRFRRQVLYAMLGAIVVILIAVPSVAGRFADLHAKPLAPGAPPPPNSLSWRVNYWRSLIPLADANPVTGIGFETVERTTPELLAPHNGFVEAYVETGVIGLAAFIWVCWELLVYLRRRARASLPGWDRLLALGAVAVALALLVQLPGENLLTQTFVFWYAAAAMTFGLPVPEPANEARGRARTGRQGDLQPVG